MMKISSLTKHVLGLLLILLLWVFYIIQEEFAFYGIYTFFPYGLHEIFSVVPYICLLLTIVWTVLLIKQIVKKKASRSHILFTLLLVVSLALQVGYFNEQADKVSATMIVTVENIDNQKGTITVASVDDNGNHKVVLEAPELLRNVISINNQQYFASYEYKKSNPNQGKLASLTMIENN